MLRKGIVLHNELLLWCQGRRSIQSLRWYWMAQAENRCMPPGLAKLETVLLLYHGSISHICNMPRLLQFYVCQLGKVRPQFSFSLWSLIKRYFTLTDRMLIAQCPSTTAIIIWSVENTAVLVTLCKHCPVYFSVKCRSSSDQTVGMLDNPGYCRASQNKGLVEWVHPGWKFWEMFNNSCYSFAVTSIMLFCLLHGEIQRTSGSWKIV